jgi:hypothetical protein
MTDSTVILQKVLADLRAQGFDGDIVGNSISFVSDHRSFLAQLWPFNRYQIADSGEFTLDGNAIRYRISAVFYVIFPTAMYTLLMLIALVIRNWWLALALIGLWFIAMILGPLIMEFRTRSALRRILVSTP